MPNSCNFIFTCAFLEKWRLEPFYIWDPAALVFTEQWNDPSLHQSKSSILACFHLSLDGETGTDNMHPSLIATLKFFSPLSNQICWKNFIVLDGDWWPRMCGNSIAFCATPRTDEMTWKVFHSFGVMTHLYRWQAPTVTQCCSHVL